MSEYTEVIAENAGPIVIIAGENGVSPTVEVKEIEGGHKVSIADVNGTQDFDVMDGNGEVINQNGGGSVKIWVGTQAEYDALSEIEDDVLYHITEE